MRRLRRDLSLLVEPTREMRREITGMILGAIARDYRSSNKRQSIDALIAEGLIDEVRARPGAAVPSVEIVLGSLVLELPPGAWQNARVRGLTWEDVISFSPPVVWRGMRRIGEDLGLVRATLSGLWGDRRGTTSPHEAGVGVDLVRLQPAEGPPLEMYVRSPHRGVMALPPLVNELHAWARENTPTVTQVLSPWWIWSDRTGVEDGPNLGHNRRARTHLNHLHVTFSAAGPQ